MKLFANALSFLLTISFSAALRGKSEAILDDTIHSDTSVDFNVPEIAKGVIINVMDKEFDARYSRDLEEIQSIDVSTLLSNGAKEYNVIALLHAYTGSPSFPLTKLHITHEGDVDGNDWYVQSIQKGKIQILEESSVVKTLKVGELHEWRVGNSIVTLNFLNSVMLNFVLDLQSVELSAVDSSPTSSPTTSPTTSPTKSPTPTSSPTYSPTTSPTKSPTPTSSPSSSPTIDCEDNTGSFHKIGGSKKLGINYCNEIAEYPKEKKYQLCKKKIKFKGSKNKLDAKEFCKQTCGKLGLGKCKHLK